MFNECIARHSMCHKHDPLAIGTFCVVLASLNGMGGLSYLPASHAKQEAKEVGLLLLLKLFDICDEFQPRAGVMDRRGDLTFEGTHLWSIHISHGTIAKQSYDAFEARSIDRQESLKWENIP